MYRTLLMMVLSVASARCARDPDTAIEREAACHEQADAWCTATGFANSAGCRSWYLHECEPSGPSGPAITESAQDACLQAIADVVSTVDTGEPALCQATW